MKRLRWIFGIPLAFIIIVGMLVLGTSLEVYFYGSWLYSGFEKYYHAFVMLINCALFVFLSSLFVPTKRKYAAIIAIVIISCLAGTSLILNIIYNKIYSIFTIRIILNYGAIFSGLLVGICMSYLVFKNRAWSKAKSIEDDKEVY